MKYKAVLRPNIPDVVIIYSAQCSVSCEWMSYITNVMKCQGYKHVISQQVESFSGELPLISETFFPCDLRLGILNMIGSISSKFANFLL